MHWIDGKELAARIRAEVREEVGRLTIQPRLHVLLVGDDPASHLYVRLKQEAAEDAGIAIHVEHVPTETPDEDLLKLLDRWNKDSAVHAILVQFPLPQGHDQDTIMAAIDPKKDVDGFHPTNVEQLLSGNAAIIPPVHEGILRLLNLSPLPINGSKAALICNSQTFSQPLERLMNRAGMFVSVMQPDELDRSALREADAIVIAVGRSRFLHAGLTKEPVVIVDVGTNRTSNGLTGDVDTATYMDKDAWITPVPGGVGPMTIAQLLKNVVRLANG